MPKTLRAGHLLALVGLLLAAPAAVAQIVVTVETDRTVYAPGEAIRASVTALNPSSIPVSLEFGWGQRAGVQIGGVPGSSCLCGYITESGTETLAPGESRTWGSGSADAFPDGRSCLDYDSGMGLCPALAEGTYTVRGYVGDGGVVHGEATTTITVTGATDVEGGPADAGALRVGPNPLGPGSAAMFRLDAPAAARVSVHDALGREVALLAVSARGAGEHRVHLGGLGLPAGVYVVRLSVDGRPADAALVTVVR